MEIIMTTAQLIRSLERPINNDIETENDMIRLMYAVRKRNQSKHIKADTIAKYLLTIITRG